MENHEKLIFTIDPNIQIQQYKESNYQYGSNTT
jgi:hypothetical protein